MSKHVLSIDELTRLFVEGDQITVLKILKSYSSIKASFTSALMYACLVRDYSSVKAAEFIKLLADNSEKK